MMVSVEIKTKSSLLSNEERLDGILPNGMIATQEDQHKACKMVKTIHKDMNNRIMAPCVLSPLIHSSGASIRI